MPTLPIFLDGKLVVGGTNAGNKPVALVVFLAKSGAASGVVR
ncbi:MAG: hypothetical protein U1F19_02070 [Lysobacterales bacterium]